ncbi:MAG: hypothetical protein ACM3XN_08095 [Chloroflexota bacterium]
MSQPEVRRPGLAGALTSVGSLFRSLIMMVLVLVLCGGISYLVIDWRLGQAERTRVDALAAYRQELDAKVAALDQRISSFEKLVGAYDPSKPVDAQASAALLSLMQDLEALRNEQAKLSEDTNNRLSGIEDALAQAKGLSSEQAQSLTGSLQLKSLLFNAQTQLMTAKVELGEQNKGRARDEVELAIATLQQAKTLAGTEAAAEIEAIIGLATQARNDLALGAPTAGDLVGLCLHRLGLLVPSLGK